MSITVIKSIEVREIQPDDRFDTQEIIDDALLALFLEVSPDCL